MTPLADAPLSDADRDANNARNRFAVVALALFALAVLAYFFTDVDRLLNLRSPQSLFAWLPPELFEGGHFRAFLMVTMTDRFSPDLELRWLLSLLALTFLSVYFAPVRHKRPLIVAWFLVIVTLLFGARPLLGLLAAHLLVYLVFHPRAPAAPRIAGFAAALATALILGHRWRDPATVATTLACSGAVGLIASWVHARWVADLLSAPRLGRMFRLAATHLPIVVLSLGALLGALAGTVLVAPFFLVLMCWHYMRLLMYGIDVEDGLVPEDLPVVTYLSVFFSPATVDSWPMGISIAQGYSYQTDRFLSRDKNALVLRGVALLGIALVYMAFGNFVLIQLVRLAGYFGIHAYPDVPQMLQYHLLRHDVKTSTVLVTSLLQHLEWIFLIGGLFHFKVGLWRLLGYDVDAYMRYPLLATNLSSLWGRLTFHWRDVLVRGFYYPVFLRMAGWPMWVRTLVATFAAAGVANWLWAHHTEDLIVQGMNWDAFVMTWRLWPVFLLLAGGIAVAQLWVTRPGRRRRPWTLDRWLPLDVLGAYVTAQFYGLLFIPYSVLSFEGGSVRDYLIIFLRGLGLA